MWHTRFASAIVSLTLLISVPSSAADTAALADPAPTPTATVERLHTALIGVMKEAETLGFEGRRQRLDPLIRTSFDLPFMAQIVMGPAWRSLSAGDQEAIVAAFSDWTVANYASQFDGWDGEQFATGSERDGGRGTVIVQTRLNAKDGPVALDYRLRKVATEWQIIDVYADSSISELATRRSEFSAILAQSGFTGLLDRIRQQTQALAQHS